ncbi:MAG: outer membrane beta-barrel protein [Spirochaetaceae bacterium]|jgi:hypothetical protein|nr:outer membrane beta-barrel protein [Spirochaetaceae bacterium]
MTNKGFLRAAAAALLLTGLTAGVSAQDQDDGGSQGGGGSQITISGGIALSTMSASVTSKGGQNATQPGVEGGVGVGGNIYLDYMLPVSIPLSLGVEIGFDKASVKDVNGSIGVAAIPLLVRAAYHFDLFPKFDLYLVGKLGGAVGTITNSPYVPSGFAFGIDVGAAYYFSSSVGVFAELGFDDYMLSVEYGPYNYTYNLPFYRFFTAGISIKF